MTAHINRVRKFLQLCREKNITLNPDKFRFAESEVNFTGYIINQEGKKPDPSKLEAIAKFPKPENLTQLRSFMGLANQLG